MAIAIEREADDVCGVMVPAGVDRVAHDIANFREYILDEGLVPAQRDPLTEVRCHANHQALAGA